MRVSACVLLYRVRARRSSSRPSPLALAAAHLAGACLPGPCPLTTQLVVCTAVFTLVAAGGYCLFGSSTNANILINLTPDRWAGSWMGGCVHGGCSTVPCPACRAGTDERQSQHELARQAS